MVEGKLNVLFNAPLTHYLLPILLYGSKTPTWYEYANSKAKLAEINLLICVYKKN